jgi:hypothetical protein
MTLSNEDKNKTVIEAAEIPLRGPIYDDVYGKLMIEVRDFGESYSRTLVIRTMIDGHAVSTMVEWDKFTDAIDGMRANMMTADWDEALVQLTGGTNLD